MKNPALEKLKAQFLRDIRDFARGKRKKYPAPLDEPLYVDLEKWGWPEPGRAHKVLTKGQRKEQLRYRQSIRHALETRVQWLFLVNGMEPVTPRSRAEWKLCDLLARHVPGLQRTNTPPKPKKRPGRAATRDPNEFYPMVIVAVEEARVRSAKMQNKPVEKVSIPTAIRNMDPKARAALGKLADSTIETRYHEAMNAWGEALLAKDRMQAQGYPPLAELGRRYKNSPTN
jgi:hypothetical protein